MARTLAPHLIEEHRVWADSSDAWDDLASSCIDAGTMIRELVNALRDETAKNHRAEGLIVIRYYLALRGAENGVTAMVTPFFCVQG